MECILSRRLSFQKTIFDLILGRGERSGWQSILVCPVLPLVFKSNNCHYVGVGIFWLYPEASGTLRRQRLPRCCMPLLSDWVGTQHLSWGEMVYCVVWMLKSNPRRCRTPDLLAVWLPSEVLRCLRIWSMTTKGCHPVLWSGECPALSLCPSLQIMKPYFGKRSNMFLLYRVLPPQTCPNEC